jgi:hypothetical protein
MAAFEYRQTQEIRDCFQRRGVRFLFLGKSGAILLGFPDTTQDADLFVEKTSENRPALVPALRELGFALTDTQAAEVERGKDFIQLKNGPFDLDLIFAPDGIERFEDACEVGEGGPRAGWVCCALEPVGAPGVAVETQACVFGGQGQREHDRRGHGILAMMKSRSQHMCHVLSCRQEE